MRFFGKIFLCLAFAQSICAVSQLSKNTSKFPDLYEASVVELQDGLERGDFTSVDLVKVSNIVKHSADSAKSNQVFYARLTSRESTK